MRWMWGYCFQCLGGAQATRSVRFKMICPCCKVKSSSWKIHTFSSGSTRSSQPQHQPPLSQEITPPLDEIFITTHPNLYYQHQTTEFRNNYAILSLAVPSPNGGARLLSTALRTDGKNDEESPQTFEYLYYIGRSLSPCLLPPVNKGAKSKIRLHLWHQLSSWRGRISLHYSDFFMDWQVRIWNFKWFNNKMQ